MQFRRTIYLILAVFGPFSGFAQLDSTLLESVKSVIVPNINTEAVEYAPSISADGKTMLFESNKTGRYELFESKLDPTTGNWSAPISIDSVNNYGKPNDLIGGPIISFDGNTMYFFSSFDEGMGREDIYYSTREEHGWSAPKNIGAPINSEVYEGFPSISSDGKTMYFVRFKPEGPSDKDLAKEMENKFCYVIYKSDKVQGEWTDPVKLPAPINRGCEKAPRIMADNRTLIFSSYQLDGMGDYDMYQSYLNDAGDWTLPVPMTFVNSEFSDQFAAMTAQGDKLYFAYNSKDIYVADIPEELQQFKNNIIQGFVKDGNADKGLGVDIYVRDAFTSDELMHLTNNPSDGRYSLVLAVGGSYNVEFRKDGYTTYATNFDLTQKDEYEEIDIDVTLYSKAHLKINVFDEEIFEPIEAKISVKGFGNSPLSIDTTTNKETGILDLDLPLGLRYEVQIEKKYFKPQSFELDVTGLTVYPEFEQDIEFSPIKKEVYINVADLTNDSKVRSRVRIRNRNRDEVIDVDGNGSVALRMGDRYEIEATSDQGYAFNSTVLDITEDTKETAVDLKLQPLIVGADLTLKDILFESNSDLLSEISSSELLRVVGLMHNNPTLEVEIAAYTDDLGSARYNKLLSDRRAKSVVSFLIENEVLENRFTAVGYGEADPVVPNEDDESRAKNRRVVLKILAI